VSVARIPGMRIAGVWTCVPRHSIDNLECGSVFGEAEVRKVVSMAGVRHRRVVDPGTTSADLCFEAAQRLLRDLGWEPESITGLMLVTQSPDYWLPSSSCLVHKWLGLSADCAAFDVGLGCSGYPYGLYLAANMLRSGGHQRILMLHGETPSRFVSPDDHATALLFGDAGSATALEAVPEAPESCFALHTDGAGYAGLIIHGGGFRDPAPRDPRELHLRMDGEAIFNFTVKRVPALIHETLALAGLEVQDVDRYLFHQSNRFIMKHIARKCGLPEERVPLTLEQFGNCGGPSVAVALTTSLADRGPTDLQVMLLGYGVGLSWSSALVVLDREARLGHADYTGSLARR
jgi:3-oxoacyl-[acyl-carrier-protein] synthase-3